MIIHTVVNLIIFGIKKHAVNIITIFLIPLMAINATVKAFLSVMI